MNNEHNCGSCGQSLPRTKSELREEFREKLKLAHNALDAFAEKRLVDTNVDREISQCRTAMEAVLRFGISGSLHDPKIDPSKVPTWGFITPLDGDD